jgi:hypothetical protein
MEQCFEKLFPYWMYQQNDLLNKLGLMKGQKETPLNTCLFVELIDP